MRSIQITRVFDAPRPVVFRYWSDPRKLEQWSGCKDSTGCAVEMDFRVGGAFTQKMQIAGHGEFSIKGTYEEIVEPERISYRVDLGFAVTRVMIEFFEEAGDRTRVVLDQDGFPDQFLCDTVSQGTTESFENLAALFASAGVAARS